MLEIAKFKEGFCQGRLIWMEGPYGTRRSRMVFELLRHCHVEENSVCSLSLEEFLKDFKKNLSHFLLRGERVFLIEGLERLRESQRARLIRVLQLARKWSFSCGIRLVFLVSEKCAFEAEMASVFPILKIAVKGCTGENIDDRVHWALELACRVTQKRVTRLSREAAEFLEIAGLELQDEGLIHTLVNAVHWNKNGCLELSDFMKPVRLPRRPSDGSVTVCN